MDALSVTLLILCIVFGWTTVYYKYISSNAYALKKESEATKLAKEMSVYQKALYIYKGTVSKCPRCMARISAISEMYAEHAKKAKTDKK